MGEDEETPMDLPRHWVDGLALFRDCTEDGDDMQGPPFVCVPDTRFQIMINGRTVDKDITSTAGAFLNKSGCVDTPWPPSNRPARGRQFCICAALR